LDAIWQVHLWGPITNCVFNPTGQDTTGTDVSAIERAGEWEEVSHFSSDWGLGECRELSRWVRYRTLIQCDRCQGGVRPPIVWPVWATPFVIICKSIPGSDAQYE